MRRESVVVQDVENKLEVYIFEPTEGLDPETCLIFNEYTKRLRSIFETRMNILSALNADMS